MDALEPDFPGVLLLSFDGHGDDPGSFTELFSSNLSATLSVDDTLQDSLSELGEHAFDGLHLENDPAAQGEPRTCLSGVITACILEIRAVSDRFNQYLVSSLSGQDIRDLFSTERYAHGSISESDGTLLRPGVTLHRSQEREA